MIIEYHEVPQQLVEETVAAVPAELNRESLRIWLSVVLTTWERDHRSAFFDNLKGDSRPDPIDP